MQRILQTRLYNIVLQSTRSHALCGNEAAAGIVPVNFKYKKARSEAQA